MVDLSELFDAVGEAVVEADATYLAPEHGWTCFHCGKTFMKPGLAREHFGAKPAQVELDRLRRERDEAIASSERWRRLCKAVLYHDERGQGVGYAETMEAIRKALADMEPPV